MLVFKEGDKEKIIGPLSIAKICKFLGVSKDIVPKYLNHFKYFKSPLLGFNVRVAEVGFIINSDDSNLNKIIHRAEVKKDYLNFNFSSLPVGLFFILNEDFTFYVEKGFNSIK